jgi:hypothetical protein
VTAPAAIATVVARGLTFGVLFENLAAGARGGDASSRSVHSESQGESNSIGDSGRPTLGIPTMLEFNRLLDVPRFPRSLAVLNRLCAAFRAALRVV